MTQLHSPAFGSPVRHRTAAALALALAAFAPTGALHGQSPDWSATVMVPAFPSPFLAEWERNPQNLTLTILYAGSGSREYVVEGVVREARRGELARAESPPLSIDGPATTQLTAADLPQWRLRVAQGSDVDDFLRVGSLPEGSYEVCVRLLTPGRVQLARDCVQFSIALPDPPELVFPGQGDVVPTTLPTFQWTPVLLPPGLGVSYRLRIVPRYEGQAPVTALLANVPHFETELAGVPFFLYPLDALPLEPGTEYVWQVEALDGMGEQLIGGGLRSQPWTFSASAATAPPATTDLALFPDTLELVPGVARLVGLRGTEIVRTAFGYTLNGDARIETIAPYATESRARLQDLELDDAGGVLRAAAGRVLGQLDADAVPASVRGRYARLDRLEYTPESGLTVHGRLQLPGTDEIVLRGAVQWTAVGLYGELRGSAAGGQPLATLGGDPVALRVREARLRLPSGELELATELDVLGADARCGVLDASVGDDGSWTAAAACAPQRSLPLATGSGRAALQLHSVYGQLDGSFEDARFAYDLSANATLALDTGAAQACATQLALGIADGAVTLRGATPRCDAGSTDVALGWLRLRLSNVRLDEFGYDAGAGFRFALRLDAEPSVTTAPALRLPVINDITVTRDGLRFPAVEMAPVLSTVDLGGYRFRVTQAATPGFEVDWAAWDAGTTSDAAFDLALEVSLPELPPGSPACIAATPLSALSARLAGGRLTAELQAHDNVDPARCRIAIGPDAALEVERLGGDVSVELYPSVSVTGDVMAAGSLVLPPAFECADATQRRLRLGSGIGSGVGIGPRGELRARIDALQPGCAIGLGAVGVTLTDATLVLDGGPGDRTALLAGGGRGEFGARQPVTGTGSITVDLIAGRITDGSLAFQGPLQLDLPRTEPFLSFTLNAAQLDSAGLRVDGRHALALPDDASVGTTFDDVVFDTRELRLRRGRVLFDAGFDVQAALAADGRIGWAVTANGGDDGFGSGARVSLPASVAMDTVGLTISGSGTGRLRYDGRDLPALDAGFNGGFTVGVAPVRVTDGVLELRQGGTLLAWIDGSGFHANLAYLGSGLVPERLGLPDVDVAYAQLRNEDGTFNVLTETTQSGIRIYSAPGREVPIAFPALAVDGGAPPMLTAALDLTLDPLGERVIAGELRVDVPAGQQSAFDLARADVPFAITRITYGAGAAGDYELRLAGRLALPGAASADGGAAIELVLLPGGTLAGSFDVPFAGRVPLAARADRLEYAFTSVSGAFDVGLIAGPRQWRIDHTGTLRIALADGEPYAVAATLRASDTGLEFGAIAAGAPDEFRFFDAGPVRLGIANVAVPRVEYSTLDGWDYDIEFDLALSFPELGGVELPPARRLMLGRDGFEIPQLRIAELQADAFEAAGFALRPLAFRMDRLRIDPFGGSLPDDWGFTFDLELGFHELGDAAPAALRGTTLTALDVGYRNGRLIGEVEARVLDTPITLPIGADGMAVNVIALGGRLSNAPAQQRIALDASVSWTVPSFMRCAAADDVVAAGTGAFTLGPDGALSGTATDVVPPCPVRLGALALAVARSDITFAYAPGSTGSAVLALDGAVRLPGPVPGDTIAAAGALTLDLVERRIVDGAIDITQPFRWELPADEPLLRFVVSRGRLDPNGLTLTGDGVLRLDGDGADAAVALAFDDLNLDIAEFRVRGGSAVFAAGFALDAALATGGIRWTARPASSLRPGQDGFRFTVMAGMRLTADGLHFAGDATAALAWADNTFPSLRVAFTDDFRLAYDPARVADGRASFLVDDAEIAYLDSRGFWPGDVLGILPVPARLPLPTEAVAYIQLRDPSTDAVLVQTSSGPDGITVSGSSLQLVVPAFAEAGVPPAVTVRLDDVVVNPATWTVVAGAIEVVGPDGGAAPLLDLAALGLRLDVRRLRYADAGSGYRLTMDGRVGLPAALRDMPVDITNVVITENGLAGQARVGSYRADYRADEAPLAALARGDLDVRVRGALIDFDRRDIELAGTLALTPFRTAAGTPSALPFTAAATAGGAFRFAASPDSLPGGVLPAGPATFRPRTIAAQPGLELIVDDSDVTVRLSGEFRLPSLNDGFAISVTGLEVGTAGVRVPEVALTEEQQFSLFGATFTLKRFADAPDAPLVLAYDGASRVFTLTMSGEVALPFTTNVPRFRGLRVATNGTVSLAQANLITQPVVMVPQVLTLATLDITDSRLRAGLDVTLPAPVAQDGTQRVHFSVAADGSVHGGGTVVLVDNAGGTGARLGVATSHLRYLDLDLAFNGAGGRGALRAVGDLDVMNDSRNRINLGYRAGGVVHPGLTVEFGGPVRWGNIRLAQDSVRLGYEVLNLTLREITVTGTPSNFELGFSGRLAFAVPAVTGGLQFQGFRMDSGLQPTFASMSVTGGHLGIANVVTMQLDDFALGMGETTIQVPAGTMPTAQSADVSTDMQDVRVSSYVSLGGSIGVGAGCGGAPDKCLFSGGVERIQFYRTVDGGRTSFVVRGAEMVLGDMLDMRGDLLYREGQAGGFELLLGASAEIMRQFSGTVVGVFDNTEPELRAGLFAAIGGAIPLAPPVVLAEVGGGFFYNARPEYLQVVQAHAGVGGGASLSPPTGRFTGLLYGNLTIEPGPLADARVLLTVSEQNARLQGAMTLLPAVTFGDQPMLSGDMDLLVGFRKKYAEGNFALRASYGPLLDGNGSLEFYVYGTDAWGVHGGGDLKYLSLVEGGADFFVGSPGFIVSGNLAAGFDFWIVAVRGEMDAAMWWQRQPADLGAYVSVAAEAALLGGVLSGSGTLRGALVGGGGSSPLVYAGALATGCAALVGCVDANIWAKFQDGRVNGGFGRDPVMDQVIARANGVRDGMYASRDAVRDNVAESRPAPDALALSSEELVQIYAQMQRSDPSGITGIFGNGKGWEENYAAYSPNWSTEAAYYDWYRVMAAQMEAPRLNNEWELRDRVTLPLVTISDRRGAVNDELRRIRSDLLRLQQLAAQPWPESPVRAVSFEQPRTRTVTDAEGNELKELESGPGFDVDAAAAEAARSELDQRRQQTDALLQQVRQQTTALENGVGSVQSALRSTGPWSLFTFASLHAQALTAAEELYARKGDVILRRQDWLRASSAELATRYSTIRNLITQKTRNMGPERARSLAQSRLRVFEQLSGNWWDMPMLDEFRAASEGLPDNDPWFAEQADTIGLQLWYHLARLGMQAADTAAMSTFQWLRSERERRLNVMWLQHAALTAQMNTLFTRKAELAGSLYDLYDRYAFWLSTADPALVPALEEERARVAGRMAELQRELHVPTVTSASVITRNRGYMAEEWLIADGSHPTGTYEYLYNSTAGSSAGFSLGAFLMQSGGTSRTTQRFALTPARGTTSESRTLRVGVRGGAGYLGLGRSLYQTHFETGGGGVGSVATAVLEHDATPPTKPTVDLRHGESWLNGSAPTVYTADRTRLELRWSAADAQSSIGEYEYAVGTLTDSTAVRGWTSAGGRTGMAVHGLELRTDDANYVYVRARNGSGIWSEVGRSVAVRYDDSPPTFGAAPAFRVTAMTTAPAAVEPDFATLNSAAVGACTLPAPAHAHQTPVTYSPVASQLTAAAPPTPFITIEAPAATDPQSGVTGYLWRIDADAPAGEYRGTGWAALDPVTRSITIEGEPLDYSREFHLSVVAENRAGLHSRPVVHTFRMPDANGPVALRFCATQAAQPGRLLLGFTSAALDPESGVAGYEYRVRHQDGTVLRDWPAAPDFESIAAGTAVMTPDLPLVDGARYYVDVRVTNGQGVATYVTSGPLRADYSAPPQPSLTSLAVTTATTLLGTQYRLDVGISAPTDPHSGLWNQHQQWAVYRLSSEPLRTAGAAAPHAFGVVPWLQAKTGSYTAQFGSSALSDLLSTVDPDEELEFRFRTINGAGVPSPVRSVRFTVRDGIIGSTEKLLDASRLKDFEF
jgi:hypothetical protein